MVGGHVRDEYIHDTPVSSYGPHIFHTSNEETWKFATRFSPFVDYTHKVQALTNFGWTPWPINRKTIETIYKGEYKDTKEEAYSDFLQDFSYHKENLVEATTFESKAVKSVGWPLYKHLIKNYSELQWQRDAQYIPSEVFGRIRLSHDYDENFFDDTHVALPKYGYSNWVTNILSHKNIAVMTNFKVTSSAIEKLKSDKDFAKVFINTSPVDELLYYEFGKLEYLKVDFKVFLGQEASEISEYWPTNVVNFTHNNSKYTRGTSYHKMYNTFYPVVILEEPGEGEELYPVRNLTSLEIFKKYKAKLNEMNILSAGRLGGFEYIDMHKAIENARELARNLLEK